MHALLGRGFTDVADADLAMYFAAIPHRALMRSVARRVVDRHVLRLKAKVSDLLVPGNTSAWPEVRDRLNRLVRGWAAYFGYGTRPPAYRAIDNHVCDRVRHFLVRRHKVPSHGINRFPVSWRARSVGPSTSRRSSTSESRPLLAEP